jgi:hypothetical protein
VRRLLAVLGAFSFPNSTAELSHLQDTLLEVPNIVIVFDHVFRRVYDLAGRLSLVLGRGPAIVERVEHESGPGDRAPHGETAVPWVQSHREFGRTMVGANVVAQFSDRVHDTVKLLQQGGDVLVVVDG